MKDYDIFYVYIRTSRWVTTTIFLLNGASVSVALRQITISQRPLHDICSFVFGATLHSTQTTIQYESILFILTNLFTYFVNNN